MVHSQQYQLPVFLWKGKKIRIGSTNFDLCFENNHYCQFDLNREKRKDLLGDSSALMMNK